MQIRGTEVYALAYCPQHNKLYETKVKDSKCDTIEIALATSVQRVWQNMVPQEGLSQDDIKLIQTYHDLYSPLSRYLASIQSLLRPTTNCRGGDIVNATKIGVRIVKNSHSADNSTYIPLEAKNVVQQERLDVEASVLNLSRILEACAEAGKSQKT